MSEKKWRLIFMGITENYDEYPLLYKGDDLVADIWKEEDAHYILNALNLLDEVREIIEAAYMNDESEAAKYINDIRNKLDELEAGDEGVTR